MNSSRKINYSTRVAKNIERKMIRDLLTRYSSSYPMDEYTYIGFGSRYFTDFLLMHKYLHIKKLISIEGDVGNKAKYEFNKPLNCIQMKYGMSNEVLPDISLDKNRSIIWLDYDGLLESCCFSDIANLIGRLSTGSVLLISYNSRPPKAAELKATYQDIDKASERLVKYLHDKHGTEYIPHNLDIKGLGKWDKYSNLLRCFIINCIEKRLQVINRGVEEKLGYKQLINFNYQDGCEMSTLGFTFFNNEADLDKLEKANLGTFDFYKESEEAYYIDVPNLTMKEVKALLEIMPLSSSSSEFKNLSAVIPPTEINSFSKIYKYLPIFIDSELA